MSRESLAKEWYDKLKSSGDLVDMFPNLSGEWSKDKSAFLIEYDSVMIDTNHLDDDDDDEFEDYEPEY